MSVLTIQQCILIQDMISRGTTERTSEAGISESDANSVKEQNTWIMHPNITGFGIGKDEQDEYILNVYLIDPDNSANEGLEIPPVVETPIGALPSGTKIIGKIISHQGPQDELDPIPPGCRIVAEPPSAKGTLGCWVVETATPDAATFLLSNSHVIANWCYDVGDPNDPKDKRDPSNDPNYPPYYVYQPDLDNKGYQIAELSKFNDIIHSGDGAYLPNTYQNKFEAALAKYTGSRAISQDTMGPAPVPAGVAIPVDPPANPNEYYLGSGVYKYGSTSGQTEGTVDDIAVKIKTKVWHKSDTDIATAEFEDQILILSDDPANDLFSMGGDSGAVVFNDDNYAVGMLWGGTLIKKDGSWVRGPWSVCCRIDTLFDHWDIELAP